MSVSAVTRAKRDPASSGRRPVLKARPAARKHTRTCAHGNGNIRADQMMDAHTGRRCRLIVCSAIGIALVVDNPPKSNDHNGSPAVRYDHAQHATRCAARRAVRIRCDLRKPSTLIRRYRPARGSTFAQRRRRRLHSEIANSKSLAAALRSDSAQPCRNDQLAQDARAAPDP